MRIGIVGSFSTGKTTLAKNLYKYFNENKKNEDKNNDFLLDINTERIVAEKLKHDFQTATELQKKKYQEDLFKYVLDSHSKANNIITDTPLILGYAYGVDDKLKELCIEKSAELYDILFYIPYSATPFENDGIRHSDLIFRKEIDEKIRQSIIKLRQLNDKIHIGIITAPEPEGKVKEVLQYMKYFKFLNQ